VIGLFEGWRAPFTEVRVEAVEVVDLGNRIAVLERFGGSGMKGSDAEFSLEQAYGRLISFKDRKIWRIKEFASLEEALEAAGLRD
jgi:hypothetical protein